MPSPERNNEMLNAEEVDFALPPPYLLSHPDSIDTLEVQLTERKLVWKYIQAWYVIGFLFACLVFLQNSSYNNSSVIAFFMQDSNDAYYFFSSITLFLLLIITSHLIYTFLSGLAEAKNDTWPVRKKSFNFYIFLTLYEMITFLFVAIFCMQDEKLFSWLNVHEIAEMNKADVMSFRRLHRVEMDMDCCGYTNFKDYFDHKEFIFGEDPKKLQFSVPQSCCNTKPCISFSENYKNLTIHRKGCSTELTKFLKRYKVSTSIAFFTLAFIQSIIVILSFRVRSLYPDEVEKGSNLKRLQTPLGTISSTYI